MMIPREVPLSLCFTLIRTYCTIDDGPMTLERSVAPRLKRHNHLMA